MYNVFEVLSQANIYIYLKCGVPDDFYNFDQKLMEESTLNKYSSKIHLYRHIKENWEEVFSKMGKIKKNWEDGHWLEED